MGTILGDKACVLIVRGYIVNRDPTVIATGIKIDRFEMSFCNYDIWWKKYESSLVPCELSAMMNQDKYWK
ncbi:MAG: hypothetical protein KGH87_04660 [Thaumarchaeota archaeon]|nr:hypothetical protein [Nitrososphaerota archaeon]MDE1839195.1 hypothetical protein [Nitrososphaerota archaeon]